MAAKAVSPQQQAADEAKAKKAQEDAAIKEYNSQRTPEQQKLITDLMKGRVQEIKAFQGDWNFLLKIRQRRAATIPLCLLSRPELCGSLKGVDKRTQIELVHFALENGADYRYNDAQAITDICYQGNIELFHVALESVGLEFMLNYRHPASKCTLLHMAAHDGRAEMTRVLLREGLLADEPDKSGQTPLFYAFARGIVNFETGRVLLNAGADPFRIDPTSECSPFSLSLANCPDFALAALDNLREVGSNRGDKRTVTYTFQNLYIHDPKIIGYDKGVELTFPRQTKNPVPGGWDTFYADKADRSSAIGYMVEFGLSKHLQHPVIRNILDRQWNAFAKLTYYHRVFEFFLMIACMSVVNGAWPRSTEQNEYEAPVPLWLIAPIVVAIPLDLRLIQHEISELRHLGFAGYFKSFWNYVDIAWHLDFNVLVVLKLLCFAHIYVYPPLLDILSTILNLLFCWKILQFASVPRVTGPLVSAFKSMLNDMKNFFTIFAIFFVTFTNALWPFFRNGANAHKTYSHMYLTLFNWMLGGWDLGDTDGFESAEAFVGTLLCFVYLVLSTVLLLNMLIAMMSNSYTSVDENSEGEWILHWADEIQALVPTANKESVATMMNQLVLDNKVGIEETIDPLAEREADPDAEPVEDKLQEIVDKNQELERQLDKVVQLISQLTEGQAAS